MLSKALVVVSVLLSVVVVSAISEKEAFAGKDACHACMTENCIGEVVVCGLESGCMDYLSCMGKCAGSDDHRALQCDRACSEGKSPSAVRAGIDIYTCGTENCKKECK